jgi:hypothetical protein
MESQAVITSVEPGSLAKLDDDTLILVLANLYIKTNIFTLIELLFIDLDYANCEIVKRLFSVDDTLTIIQEPQCSQ